METGDISPRIFYLGKRSQWVATLSRPVFLNRQAAARYRALASIIPGLERFWKLSFYFS